MGILKKINWLITFISFSILKKNLVHKIGGKENKQWLQTPLHKVHIYNRLDFIMQYCTGKKILHIGCTDHPFTKQKIENKSLLHTNIKKIASSILGIDNNTQAIEEYKKITGDEEVYFGDITEKYPDEIKQNKFDIILLGEVLEHLENPAKAINIIHQTFSAGTKILVTVPNYAALDSFASSLNKTESIHPDHYWYFSPYTLSKLFNKDNFELQQLDFGMYYKKGRKINAVMKAFPFNGDCIIATFLIKK